MQPGVAGQPKVAMLCTSTGGTAAGRGGAAQSRAGAGNSWIVVGEFNNQHADVAHQCLGASWENRPGHRAVHPPRGCAGGAADMTTLGKH